MTDESQNIKLLLCTVKHETNPSGLHEYFLAENIEVFGLQKLSDPQH